MLWLDLLFSFHGRVGRLAYLLTTLAITIVYALILCVGIWVLGLTMLHLLIMPWWGHLLALVLCWPNLALTVKRYHDLNMSGWWVLLPFATIVFSIVAGIATFVTATASRDGGMIALLIYGLGIIAILLWSLWQTIKLVFFSGSAGTNRFGGPPRLAQHLFGDDGEPGIEARAEPVTTPVTRVVRDSRPRQSPAKPAAFGKR